MARTAMYIVQGALTANRAMLRHKYGVSRENCVFICQYMVFEEYIHKQRHLSQVRDGYLHLPLSLCEGHALIEYVCIM